MSSQLKTKVLTDKAPVALPDVLSQAIIANGMVYCSGQVGVDPKTGKMVDGDVGVRTHQIIQNLTAVLSATGSSIENVVKVNVFLTTMENFAPMNEVYKQYWGDMKPGRTCVAVHQLPQGTDVEIECVAVLPTASKL